MELNEVAAVDGEDGTFFFDGVAEDFVIGDLLIGVACFLSGENVVT